jgi:hypothetical protein
MLTAATTHCIGKSCVFPGVPSAGFLLVTGAFLLIVVAVLRLGIRRRWW